MWRLCWSFHQYVFHIQPRCSLVWSALVNCRPDALWAHFASSPFFVLHLLTYLSQKNSNAPPGSFTGSEMDISFLFFVNVRESALTRWTCNAIALPSERSAWWELMPDSCPVLLCHSNLLPSEVLSQRAPDSLTDNSSRAAGLTCNLALWCISQ